jgi:hypothetical protein
MDETTITLAAGPSMLLRAMGVAGGIESLARHLRVPKKQLASWIDGEVDTPDGVFARTIDFLRGARA